MGTLPRIGSKTAGGSMLQGVQLAIDAMHWLKPSDGGMVTLALKYAEQVDVATAQGDLGKIGYLGQQLHGVLRSLGGSPAERKALNIEGVSDGKLRELRAARAGRKRDAADLDPSVT
jgi:hypothetical protein